MSTVVTIDSTALELEAGKAYLFADNSGVETLYKYQLASGTTGNITTGVLTALGVSVDSLPVIVYQADLLRCLNETISSVDGVTVANDGKASASVEYVKRSVSNKLDKAEFLTKTAVMEKKIADLEENGGGSSNPGSTPAPSSVTEIYNTTDTTATVAVEDGKCYRYKLPLSSLVVSSVERGLTGSSMLFKCQNRSSLADPSVVKIGAFGHWYYNDDNEFVNNYTAPHEWTMAVVDGTVAGTARVYEASFTGADPGIEDPNNAGHVGGVQSDSASWLLRCAFNTTANRWQITGSYSYTIPGEDLFVVTLATAGGQTINVPLTKQAEYNGSPCILYSNDDWDLRVVAFDIGDSEYAGIALIKGSFYESPYMGDYTTFMNNCLAAEYWWYDISKLLNSNKSSFDGDGVTVTHGGVTYTTFSNSNSASHWCYTETTVGATVSDSGVIMQADVGVTEIGTNTWAAVDGGAYLPGGYGANEAGSGGDGLVPSLRNAYVDISQNTITLPPSITFPASLNKIEDKVFEANKAYFVSFWNNLLTVKEVTLGSTGEV